MVVRSNQRGASAKVLSGSLKSTSPHIDIWSWAGNTKPQFLSFHMCKMGYGNICITGLNEMLYRKGNFLEAQLVKNPSGNAGDLSSIPGSGRSPREGIGYLLQYSWASLVVQMEKNLPTMLETWVRSLGWGDPLEKEIATHSSILAWRIQWTEETARLQSFWFQSWKWLSKGPVAQKALHKCYLNYYCYYFIFSPPSTVLTSCLYYIRAHI